MGVMIAGCGGEGGPAVALSEDTALVGAYRDTDLGVDAGSAYVFVRNAGIWTQQAKLLANDGTGGDCFGSVVALSEDTALFGAYLDSDEGVEAGSAYVYVRSGGAWVQQAKLLVNNSAADQIGASVAMAGNTALLGAPGDADKSNNAGAAYVFVLASSREMRARLPQNARAAFVWTTSAATRRAEEARPAIARRVTSRRERRWTGRVRSCRPVSNAVLPQVCVTWPRRVTGKPRNVQRTVLWLMELPARMACVKPARV